MSDLHISPTLKRIFLESLILCALALTVGITLNYPLLMDAFTGKTVSAKQVKKAAVKPSAETNVAQLYPDMVELDEIDELLAEGALLVDARHKDDFSDGHLAGAVSLPLGTAATDVVSFMAQVPLQRTLILYCNGFGCPDSFELGTLLLAKGYQEVLVYEGGFPEWRDAGRLLEVGE